MTHDTIGVGPHPKPWPSDERYDPELLEHGDRRNVEDQYRYWTTDAIKQQLATQRTLLHVAIENWQHDFNIGTIVRSANAFNVGAVHIIGRRRWNRRGAMVTDKYMPVFHHETVEDFVVAVAQKQIYVVDNVPGAHNLSESELPEDAVLVFGGEGPGVSEQLRSRAQAIVQIEQFGSTRSVNVGVAAGIVMYEWMRRHRLT